MGSRRRRRARVLAALGLLAGALGLTIAVSSCASPSVAVGDTAPDFEAVTDRGDRMRLYDVLADKRVVLFFYAADGTYG